MTGEPPSSPARPVRWQLVVPVKRSDLAKTRLEPPHPLSRPPLARAVAADTLREVCRALPPGQVTVVTCDPDASALAQRLGARVVADPGAGLNAAIGAGWVEPASPADWAEPAPPADVAQPGPGADAVPGWAVLLGDLPALRAEDLVAALERCAAEPSAVVPDADGTGTVLLASTLGPPSPRFGPGSAARHAQDATLLELDLPRLRRDVDTATDLAQAVSLGVGPATARALALR